MKDIGATAAPDLIREFVYSLELLNPGKSKSFAQPHIDESKTRRQLMEEFPELVWRDEEGNLGKIFFTGESQETPPEIGISFSCNETRGPFKLTVRLRNAGLIRAEELKDRVRQALPGVCLSQNQFACMSVDDYYSIPWVNAPQRAVRTAPDLPSVNKNPSSPFVELKLPVERPCIAIFDSVFEILISRALLEAMAARIDEIKIKGKKLSEEERLETLRGSRAREILTAAVPVGMDGNSQLPMALLPQEATYLLGQLLEYGLVEVVHFTHHGIALSAERIQITPFGMRAGPTAGFGGVRFSIGLGKEIFSLHTWVS